MKKSHLLISTIGKHKDIYKSLMYVIEQLGIEEVVYLVSDDRAVLSTFKFISNFCQERGLKVGRIDLFDVERFQNIIKVLERSAIKETISLIRKNKGMVYLDFTYGTKALSGGALFFALDNWLVDEVIYVTGTRKDGVVVGNFELVRYPIKRLLLEKNLKKVNEWLKSFQFGQIVDALQETMFARTGFTASLNRFFSIYQELTKGSFSVFPEKILKDLASLFDENFLDKILRTNQKINEFNLLRKKLEKKINLNNRETKIYFQFQIGYFYDLVKINFIQRQYPQVLALFVSLVDRFLTLKLWERAFDDEDIFFDETMMNYHLKRPSISLDPKKKLPPASVSIKLEKLAGLDKNLKEEITRIIQLRNESLFGHGFRYPKESDASLALALAKTLVEKAGIELFDNGYYFYYPLNMDFSSVTA